jgi:hypothetical protein
MSLKRLIKGLRQESRPVKKCKKALWRQLDHKFDHMYPAAQRLVPRPAVIIAVVVLIAVGVGTSAYAYESPEVVEGHPLHFLKQNIENIEGRLKFSPEQRAGWHLKMQDRRMKEAEHFANKNDFRKSLLEKGIGEIGPGLDEAKRIEVKDARQEMLKHMSEMEQKHIEILQQIKPQLSEYSQQVIDRIIAEHTKRLQEQVSGFAMEEQKQFVPLQMRRFKIMYIGAPAINSSSDVIVTADMLPEDFANMQIIMLGP